MAKKGGKATNNEVKAGARNLAEWKQENPSGGALKHGAFSRVVRRRYSDLRTRLGRALKAAIDGLIDDLGGPEALTMGQLLILDRVREKLITLSQIGSYIDFRKEEIIDNEGKLLPVLSNNYLSYAESLRRDITTLYKMNKKRSGLTYEQVIKQMLAETEGGEKA